MSLFQFIAAFLLSASVFLGACSGPRTVVAQTSKPSEAASDAASDVPRSREADDIARFLAGMPGTAGSPYQALEETAAWKEHRRLLDAAWQTTESDLLSGFRKFQSDQLNNAGLESRAVFYPFSGPDAL